MTQVLDLEPVEHQRVTQGRCKSVPEMAVEPDKMVAEMERNRCETGEKVDLPSKTSKISENFSDSPPTPHGHIIRDYNIMP